MTTVAIIDDHQVFADALGMMLRSEAEFEFIGTAGTLAAGRSLIKNSPPDVLLLDIGLPDGDGLSLVGEVKRQRLNTQVVVLTCYADENTLIRAFDTGVTGFMSKSCSLAELIATIRQAAQGEIIMPVSLMSGLLKRLTREKTVMYRKDQLWEKLTIREQEILEHLAKGHSGATIAADLNITPMTVRTHIRNLMSKLGVHSRLEAVAFALENNLISVPA